MKHSFHRFVVTLLALLLVASAVGVAQESRTGTNAASELLIPVAARYIGMSGAPLAVVSGIDAIYYNPAGLSASDKTAYGMFSQMRYIADINVNYAAASINFEGIGSVGFSIKSLDIGDIPITTVDAPDGTGASFAPQFITVGLTYSRALSDRVYVGTTANLISETMDRVSANGFAFDFGVQYRGVGDIEGLSLGLAIKNVGPALQYGGTGLLYQGQLNDVDRLTSPYKLEAAKDELPSTLEFGLNYSISIDEMSKLDVAGLYQDQNFQDDIGTVGVEYAYDKMLFARFGYSMAPNAKDSNDEAAYNYGFTLGAGVNLNVNSVDVRVDYAFRQNEFFDANNVFSLVLGF